MIAHVTPSVSDASSEFIKAFTMRKLSERALPTQVMRASTGFSRPAPQARKSTPSNAWARKIPAPTRPINAVTVSIIANILCEPRENKTTWHPAQSKGFRKTKSNRGDEDSAQQDVPNQSNKSRFAVLYVPSMNTREYTGRSQRSVHHLKALPISAVFRMRYPRNSVRRVGARRNALPKRLDIGIYPAEW